jgi:hypothetical protein
MSERGQGQGQGGQGQQNYVVKTDFTDAQGKRWTVGSAFKGDPDAVRKALAAGQIAQKPDEGEGEAEPKA